MNGKVGEGQQVSRWAGADVGGHVGEGVFPDRPAPHRTIN